MSKPNWANAPEWANYLAMDSDGAWWWFEVAPSLKSSTWEIPKLSGFAMMQAVDHLPDFTKTLEHRP